MFMSNHTLRVNTLCLPMLNVLKKFPQHNFYKNFMQLAHADSSRNFLLSFLFYIHYNVCQDKDTFFVISHVNILWFVNCGGGGEPRWQANMNQSQHAGPPLVVTKRVGCKIQSNP